MISLCPAAARQAVHQLSHRSASLRSNAASCSSLNGGDTASSTQRSSGRPRPSSRPSSFFSLQTSSQRIPSSSGQFRWMSSAGKRDFYSVLGVNKNADKVRRRGEPE